MFTYFLLALGADCMTQPDTDQHQGRIAVWETVHHTGTTADIPIQPLNHIVGADAEPVFAGEITTGKCLFNTILLEFGRLEGDLPRSDASKLRERSESVDTENF